MIHTQKLYDLEDLEMIAGDDREFLISLSKVFITTIPVDSKQLVEAAKASDWGKVSKLSHKLKSTIDSMNIETIRTDIRTLEANSKNKSNTDSLPELALKVDKIIQIVVEQVKEEFGI